jgi:subtilisin-like proprotein convertase family protein/sugar lactone lactonase YvrE
LGQINQWHFYIIINYGPTDDFTNAAFVTFLPPTLAIPQEGALNLQGTVANSTRPEADIDLLVASGPGAWALTNLDPTVISNCVNGAQVGYSNPKGTLNAGVFYGADLGRGGSDFVVDTNSTPGQVYYVGVQSQDQMASEYDFLSEFSNIPFSQNGANGESVAFYPVTIPDGDATHPGFTNSIGLAIYPISIQRAVDTNVIAQQNVGDLVITLNHPTSALGNGSVVLLNHDSPNTPGIYTNIYDDSGQGDIPYSQPSDGPGSLNTFQQQQGAGIWILHTADSAPGFVGSITNNSLFLYRHQDLTGITNITVTIPPNSWFYDYVDVPVGNTNLFVFAIDETPTLPPSPLTLAVKYGSNPTTNNADEQVLLTNSCPAPLGWSNSISVGPPLTPGTYYIGIYNPNMVAQTVELGARLGFSAAAETTVDFPSTDTPILLPDDAVTTDYINVATNAVIEGFNVGLRVDHPRISDLAFTLIGPDGSRYLLMENRGGYTANGCGVTTITTNIVNVNASGGPNATTNFIPTGETSGKINISYNMYTVPDQMTVYYSTNAIFSNLITNIFTSFTGQLTVSFPPPGVPATSTYLTIVMNASNHPPSTFWNYTVGGVQTNYYYLAFTEDTNLTTTPIKYAVPPFIPTTFAGQVFTDSFEPYPINTYSNGTLFGNWTVLTNSVNITNYPPAYDGPNLLALNNGAVSNTLPTVPGRKYTLQYAQGAQPFAGLYAANFNNGTVESYPLPNTNGTQFAGGFQSPAAVAFDGSGNLYMADASANTISKITPGGVVSLFAGTGAYPNALVFDGGGNLYCANYFGNTIQKITPAGVVSVYESDPGNGSVLNGPAGLAFDGTGTNLYVADFNDNKIKIFSAPNTPGTIFVADPGNQSVLASPASLVFDSTGTNLFVANNNGTSVEEFPTPGTNGTFIIIGLVNPTGLAFDNSGDLFVADSGAGLGIIYEYTTNGVLNNFTSSGLNDPFGLAYYSNINPEATNSAGWQVQTLTFTATQTGTPLVLDASGGNYAAGTIVANNFSPLALFDAFTLSELPSELYYQAEQSLAPIIGTGAAGNWGMEVLDSRTGATSINAALVSWQLEFVFANTNLPLPSLIGFVERTNQVAANSIYWYQVPVPANANFATNRLLSADQPVNLWFSPNNPPTITNPAGGDYQLLGSVTNGSFVISTITTPTLVPGATYYLGVQNTNSAGVNAGVEVDFDHGNASPGPASLHFSSIKASASRPQLSWSAARGAHYQIQWANQITLPMVWNTITNPTTTSVNGVSTFTDTGAQTAPVGPKRFYRLVKTP